MKTTLTQIKLCKAYEALDNFAKSIALPATKAFAIYMLAKSVKPLYEARVDVERDIIERFDIKVNGGRFIFNTQEDAEAYSREMSLLNENEVEIDIMPVVIALDDIGDQKITPAQMEALEGFVRFE